MADEIIIRNETTLPSDGQVQAVCVDVVSLGAKVDQYQNNPPEVVQKAAIVFQIAEDNPDTGKVFELSVEYTISFGKKANLRKFLESWRGRPYTPEEAAKGIPLHKLTGFNAILTVTHVVSGAGNTYAKVTNATPLMKGMPSIAAKDYTRAEFWEKRKAEYAEGVAKHRAAQNPPARTIDETLAAAAAESDSLPF
jgi:hypothetical protein